MRGVLDVCECAAGCRDVCCRLSGVLSVASFVVLFVVCVDA